MVFLCLFDDGLHDSKLVSYSELSMLLRKLHLLF